MITVAPSASYEATLELGTSGLVGTLKVGTYDGDTATQALSTADINEIGTSGVYVATRTAPGTGGQYVLIWTEDGTLDPDKVTTEDLLVTYSRATAGAPSGRDLCTLDDVTAYVPAYQSDSTTDAKLQQMITAQSELMMDESGREIVTLGDSDPRVFDIGRPQAYRGHVRIGDCADISLLELLNRDGTLVESVDLDTVVQIYDNGERQQTAGWEPVVRLEFRVALGAPVLVCGQALRITASWGFPEIPPFIREACAARVILRYVSDVASSGDAFSETVAEDALNLGAMFRSSTEAVARLQQMVMA